MRPDPVVAADHLTVSYGGGRRVERATVLDDLTFSIRRGEFVLLAGASGSGKSTLLRCINGLIPHSHDGAMAGRVSVVGMDTREHQVCEIAQQVGTVFQNPDYQLFCTDVESEIAFGPEQCGIPPDEITARVEHAMSAVDIAHLINRETDALSWGERQRLAIAAVLSMEPAVLLLDEPVSGIDAETAQHLLNTLARLNQERGLTVILAEHRIGTVLPSCTRVIALHDGKMIYDGPAEGYAAAPGHSAGMEGPLISPGTTPAITFKEITVCRPGREEPVLDSVSLSVHAGEIVFLTGPNGSGKTTLLRCANGLLRPDSGEVNVRGRPIGTRSVAEVASSVGFLPQHADTHLFAETVREEIAFGPGNLDHEPGRIERSIKHLIRALDLLAIGPDAPPLSLSVGEKQRLAIASILAMDTPIIILDEPTLGLDVRRKTDLAAVLRERSAHGAAVLIATHDPDFITLTGGRVVTLQGGRLLRGEGP
ncbi:ABC transporter ATP-binding protein [Methanofollis fontis]|uniref:ABC transporter domain-containing protein n=1 Tax=Methanofollis fontis TaxID=2052832 RepID=A0A483CTG7_9EURY|nr:ABC transporter ATP-binding protein [Methanofollis fontis]TAJ44548.1 hypothetical protein CUJ86_04330 [Methanofollis fontis]